MKKIGKWSDKNVPHKGWFCVDVEDLGEVAAVCQMCEQQDIRFVHYMQHEDYPDILGCGCDCAGNMQNNYVMARYLDEKMRSRAAKRKRWLTRKWKTSAKGNEYIVTDGFRCIITYNNGYYSYTVVGVLSGVVFHSRKIFNNANDAKLSVFDTITRAIK